MGWTGEEAVKLIREVGIGRLGPFDGCVCSDVKVRGFEIDVSCRKSSGSTVGSEIDPDFYGTLIRVSSRHLDIEQADCALVADEVLRQLSEGGDSQKMIRLCSAKDDAENRCQYCHEPRAERWGYFCAKHLTPESRNAW